MYVLGVNIGHNATACLLKDGAIVSCVSEERFSRIKNHFGIPFKSIAFVLKENKISIDDINYLVLDSHYSIENYPDFGKKFLKEYTEKSLKKKTLSKLGYAFPEIFKKYYLTKERHSNLNKRNSENVRKKLSSIFNISEEKIKLIDHHLAHALSTCFNLKGKTLIFTLDGEGNGFCASVNIFDGKELKVISKSKKYASPGYLYSIATIYLGMKPFEHEFKVMGLAPYAKEHKIDEIYDKFKKLIWINNNLEFESKINMPFIDHFFKEELKFVRFDVIAGAVQRLIEELTQEWVRKAVEKTGIKNVALSGGVFMNVKAAMKISQLKGVKDLFVMPSSGDESNPIGCCFYGYWLYCKENNIKLSPKQITDLYLGPEYDNNYIENLIKRENLRKKYKIKNIKNINLEIAKLLARGEIVARCSGKSEWGARALGNRSILANPINKDIIRILNETIKDRDFWMPFTPSILDGDANKYLINPKNIFAPYMVLAFDSSEIAKKHLPAAMHPYDFTIRPQVVTKDYNKDYYEIIKNFKKRSKIGAVLNTSFNLHGEPNVLTPEDALRTVENSDLRYLAMGNYLFEKQ